MTIKARPFDAANYIETAADQADLLNDAIDSGDPRYIAMRWARSPVRGAASRGWRARPALTARRCTRR